MRSENMKLKEWIGKYKHSDFLGKVRIRTLFLFVCGLVAVVFKFVVGCFYPVAGLALFFALRSLYRHVQRYLFEEQGKQQGKGFFRYCSHSFACGDPVSRLRVREKHSARTGLPISDSTGRDRQYHDYCDVYRFACRRP